MFLRGSYDLIGGQMRELYLPIIIFGAGVGLGCLITGAGTPVPKQSSSCVIPRVSTQTVTAYVLKPPPAPPAEKIVVREACVTPKPENVSQPELTNTDDTQTKPKRRYRHHRYRRCAACFRRLQPQPGVLILRARSDESDGRQFRARHVLVRQ